MEKMKIERAWINYPQKKKCEYAWHSASKYISPKKKKW